MDRSRIHARDSALRRLRRLTAIAVTGAGALALAFAVLAARTFAGHATTHARVVQRRPVHRPAQRRHVAQTAPSLVAVATPAPSPPPAQAAPVQAAPVPAAAPPVVVSGGS